MKKILLVALCGMMGCEMRPAHLLVNSTNLTQNLSPDDAACCLVGVYYGAVVTLFAPLIACGHCLEKKHRRSAKNLSRRDSVEDEHVAEKTEAYQFFGVAEDKGVRDSMEDAHAIEKTKKYHFFGLYDGHRGRAVADFAAQYLHLQFKEIFEINKWKKRKTTARALRWSFMSTHNKFNKQHPNLLGGSCALAAVLYKNRLCVASAGDSRAVVCSGGEAYPLSDDHKPGSPSEQSRLEAAGAVLVHDKYINGLRIKSHDGLGAIATSRSLGDRAYAGLVIPNPDINSRVLTEKDEFLILACDGVWDVFSNGGAVSVVRSYLKKHPRDARGAARYLKAIALLRGSQDNITVIIVDLASYVESLAR